MSHFPGRCLPCLETTHKQKETSDTSSHNLAFEPKDDCVNLPSFKAGSAAPILPGSTIVTLHERFDAEKQVYATSIAREQLERIFAGIASAQASKSTFKITNCLALGLASVSGARLDLPAGDHDTRIKHLMKISMKQLVAFYAMVELLRQHHDIQDVYCQDPSFNDLDKEFLASLNYKVIDSPASNNVISEESFFFAPHLVIFAIYASLRQAFPAMYLGNPLHENQEWVYSDHSWVKEMMKEFLLARTTITGVRMFAYDEWKTQDKSYLDGFPLHGFDENPNIWATIYHK